MSKEFIVIGLGTFGRNVALRLTQIGQSVMAIDLDKARVDQVSEALEAVICVDATDEEAMRELHVERASCAVVAIGADAVEASILATALLKQIGVPHIVARGLSELHARVLAAVGADEVVQVEAEMGQRLARRLAQPNVLERLRLGEGAELAEVQVPESFVGKTLVSLDIRRKYNVTVVALKREESIRALLRGETTLESGDLMVVIGESDDISKLAALA